MNMNELNIRPQNNIETTAKSNKDTDHWRDLVREISTEIAVPLTAALHRIQEFSTTGRIDRTSLQALNSEIQQAQLVSFSGKELVRLASSDLRQMPEPIPLSKTLMDLLAHRQSEILARKIQIKQMLCPAVIMVDASLLAVLINTMLTWSIAHAQSSISLQVELKAVPAHAQLSCQFTYRPDAPGKNSVSPSQHPAIDSSSWRLLQQAAWLMGLPIERTFDNLQMDLMIRFPHVVKEQLTSTHKSEFDQILPSAVESKSLRGSQVLMVASRKEVRLQLRDAIRHMGLVVDFVNSIDEAREFCYAGMPHAIVFESVLRGNRFNEFREEVYEAEPPAVFIEIIEEGNTFEVSGFGGHDMARIGRDAILESLPSALVFELSRSH